MNDDVYDLFIEQIGLDTEPSVVYMNWLEIATNILKKKKNGDVLWQN